MNEAEITTTTTTTIRDDVPRSIRRVARVVRGGRCPPYVGSIGASWVTMGPAIGQVALAYGASDMGSAMMEENVVSAAGTTHCLNEALICRLIRDAGFLPAQRNNEYDLLRVHDGPGSPDLSLDDWSTTRAGRLHVHTDAGASEGVELSIGVTEEAPS